MMQLVLFLALGSGLIILLFLLARRNRRVEGSAQVVFEARQALVALQMELFPRRFWAGFSNGATWNMSPLKLRPRYKSSSLRNGKKSFFPG